MTVSGKELGSPITFLKFVGFKNIDVGERFGINLSGYQFLI